MNKPNLITGSELLRRKGWTTQTISEFLVDPDEQVVKRLPHKTFTINLFAVDRIAEVEATAEWQALSDGQFYSDKRAARTVSRENAMDRVRTFDIKVRNSDLDRNFIQLAAVASYNERKTFQRSKAGLSPHIPKTPATMPADVLTRLTLNYLRHNFTNYDEAVKRLAVAEGAKEEYLTLRARYFEALRHHFPDYADALTKQEHGDAEVDYDYYKRILSAPRGH